MDIHKSAYFFVSPEANEKQEIVNYLKEKPSNNSLFSKCHVCSGFEDKILPAKEKAELAESEKHEILVKLAEGLDQGPHGLAIAEEIFEDLKYRIARFVLFYEFNEKIPLSTQLALWLDMKMNPKQKKRMELLIHHFFQTKKTNK